MTAEGPRAFLAELEALEYTPELLTERFVAFDYVPEVGPVEGRAVRVALEPIDHPRTPPTGPFVSPRLLPIRPEATSAPYGGVHEAAGRSGFEDPEGVWQYWSRPFNEWGDHGRTARSYLDIHLRRLFAALPDELEMPCAA